MDRSTSRSKIAGPAPTQISLPKPVRGRATSVFTALAKRKTHRQIKDRNLSVQMLSNLLWAACGINRKQGPFGVPGRTAASASNSQEIDVYVALRQGTYRYAPGAHCLDLVTGEDLRPHAIGQGQGTAGAAAPVRLVYVVDVDKFKNAGFQEPGLKDPETQKAYYHVDAGLIAANVYLFAASQGLATWFHNCNKTVLGPRLGLRPAQRVLFGQTVGYPERS